MSYHLGKFRYNAVQIQQMVKILKCQFLRKLTYGSPIQGITKLIQRFLLQGPRKKIIAKYLESYALSPKKTWDFYSV